MKSLFACVGRALILLGVLPAMAWSQVSSSGGIAGVARDTTGAVLPGVTVEAASPALIEKVRVVVTDDQGNYKIVDLRPGTYSVTFTLPGFATFKRDGILISAGFTASANAEMKVGSLEETVTVTGASPIVDVQNIRTQNVLSQQVIEALPTNKTLPAYAALTLGATVGAGAHDVGGNRGEPHIGISIHGSRFNDSKLLLDGMSFNSLHFEGGGQMKTYYLNQTSIQETVLGTGGTIAESDTGGVLMNHVPREGGNSFRVEIIGNYTNTSLQADNLSDDLQARGLTAVAPLRHVYDWGVGVGGRIRRDRLWFYAANRWWGASNYAIGSYFNKSGSNFIYEPDLDRQGSLDTVARDHAVRLTWQAAAKHKVNVSVNLQKSCQCFQGVSAIVAPEAAALRRYDPLLLQSTWSYPRTNRLLVDAGASFGFFESNTPRYETVKPTDIRIIEQTTGLSWGAVGTTLGSGVAYGLGQHSDNHNQRASVSYITGSHAVKVGAQTQFGRHYQFQEINEALNYTFRSGVPISLTQFASPFEGTSNIRGLGLFVQDQWTVHRFTINAGVRYDRFKGWNPPQTRPAGRFTDAIPSPLVDDVPNYTDITPRGGVAYDVFGNGKTAIKLAIGQYLGSQGAGLAAATLPGLAIGESATRTWTDGNSNFIPDCVLTSFVANGECGALTSVTFGRPIATLIYGEDVTTGWNTRYRNLQTSLTAQHEVRPGWAVNIGYFRTSFSNFSAQENQAVTAADFGAYCVATPADARLPGGGNQQICGLFDVNPNRFGLVRNVITKEDRLGTRTEVFNGVDVSMSGRFGRNGLVSGGVSTGRTLEDFCYANDLPQVTSGSFGGANGAGLARTGPRVEAWCNPDIPWSANTQVKFNAVYPVPGGVQASVMFQNLPGIAVSANRPYTNAEIAPQLGRNLSAGAAATATVAIVPPGSMYEDRLTQVDVRVTKTLRLGKARVQGMFDVYNLFNGSTILAINTNYGPAWLRPTTVLGARLLKLGVQVDY